MRVTPDEFNAHIPSEIAKRLAEDGSSVAATTPEEFRALIHRETAKWTQIVKATGIQPQ